MSLRNELKVKTRPHIFKAYCLAGISSSVPFLSLSKPCPQRKTVKKSSPTFLAAAVAHSLKLPASQSLPKML